MKDFVDSFKVCDWAHKHKAQYQTTPYKQDGYIVVSVKFPVKKEYDLACKYARRWAPNALILFGELEERRCGGDPV